MSAQSIRSTQEPSRLGIAFVTALALHGAVLGGLTLWHSTERDNPPGEQEITINLAPAMEEAVSVAPAEIAAVAAPSAEPETVPLEPETFEPLPPEEVPAEQTKEVTELLEPQEPTEVPPVEAELATEPEPVVALPPPEMVVAKPLQEPPSLRPEPKPEKKPPPSKPIERKPSQRRAAAQPPQPPSEARQGQASSSRENTGGAAASADPNVLNRYVSSLTAALRGRLRYPNIARSQGVSGLATLRFTMDRSGRIISATLVRSAGHPALDQAALAAAGPGSSLPPAPAALPQQQFTISVPLRFNLR
ncbi:TonB family protein [Microvirga sp. CF3062]|uniref:TonB family protein n=1 Tax=Microvirga sp. CF3062 TaxID=3110182 RepID=UPI002E77F6F7|nr:TonB family protein [Microvirga sp. CF3062]MEE1655431.1 TonB family protein [Microvirga sp. CF3062]